MPQATLVTVQSCTVARGSLAIGSASKMIHLLGILVVWKGQYSPKCVLGSFFAINGKNAYKNLNNCPNNCQKHDVKFNYWKCIKNTIFVCLAVKGSQCPNYVFAGILSCFNWQKSTQKSQNLLINYPVTRYKVQSL